MRGQYLSFRLGGQGYAVPIGAVREINQHAGATPIPGAPDFVVGVTNLRGKIVPVVDLKMKLGMSAAAATRQTCIVIIESDQGLVGMVVDQVDDVVELSEAQVEPAPQLGAATKDGLVIGLGKLEERILVLVDIRRALSKELLLEKLRIDGTAA